MEVEQQFPENISTNIYFFIFILFYFLYKCDFDTAALMFNVMLYKRRRRQLTTCQLHHIWTFGKAISVFSSFLFYSVSFSHTYAETHKLEKPHMYAEHILNMSNQARV